MIEDYVPDSQYPAYFRTLEGLRSRIVGDLPLASGRRVLDLATGYGFFAVEIARCLETIEVVGVDISQTDTIRARQYIETQRLDYRVSVVQADATQRMPFADQSFDTVVNFLGLEDIHMTRGKTGVEKSFVEVKRILKAGGLFCFVVMPPEMMETDAQKLEVALFSFICDATWLSYVEYTTLLTNAGLRLVDSRAYYTCKKLTPAQSREEILFACEHVPLIYDKAVPTFDEVWQRFGEAIEQHGLGHYSKVVLMIARKCL
jgi:ubiquinone/menaquinone biosynthesis C-methylase UbiE